MKLKRLQIDGYKNLRGCDIEFTSTHLINAVIGGNGSGKSNLIEAILQILVGFYFEKPPKFHFSLEFEAQNRSIVLQRDDLGPSVTVDDEHYPLDRVAKRLREGQSQVFYPELTLVYYSGECRRVQRLISRYRRNFQRLTRAENTDRFRPLFVQSSNDQADVILLALYAHGHREVLNQLRLEELFDVRIAVRSPVGFDPERHEPKLWNTEGTIRRIVSDLNETTSSEDLLRSPELLEEAVVGQESHQKPRAYSEERIYRFADEGIRTGLPALAACRTYGDGRDDVIQGKDGRPLYHR